MIARRIGIDVTSALTQRGGIGRYTRELVNAVVALNSEDKFQLFSARIPNFELANRSLPLADNVSYRIAPFSERWLYRLWYRARLPLPVQWFTGSLDLYHSPDFVLPPTSGRIPTLLTVHDLSFLYFPQSFPPALVDYLNHIVPWSVKRATHILADSRSTRQDLLSKWQVPAEKVTVLYSGVGRNFRPIENQALIKTTRQKYGLDQRPYVLAVGTIQPRKNYQMLVRAFRPVALRLPHNLVFIGGKGWLNEPLKHEIKRQGLSERIKFTGFVADDDLPALYCGASLLAFPSLYEGFGLPIVEAMACGLPCLISETSSLPEVGGQAAILLSPRSDAIWSETMLSVLTDTVKQMQMRADGFKQARLFSWKKAASELMQIYNFLLNASS